MLLADRTGTPEIAITLDEAHLLTDRAQNVLRHYSVETTQKTLDWIGLTIALGSIYVPRAVAISIRHRHAPSKTSPQSGATRTERPAALKPNGAAGPARPAAPPTPADMFPDFTNAAPDQEDA